VKTTVEISDSLLAEAKNLAGSRGTTLRQLIEDGLRENLRKSRKRPVRFRLQDGSVNGKGLQEPLSWPKIRQRIYEGRGE
jgi:hypothetical protein